MAATSTTVTIQPGLAVFSDDTDPFPVEPGDRVVSHISAGEDPHTVNVFDGDVFVARFDAGWMVEIEFAHGTFTPAPDRSIEIIYRGDRAAWNAAKGYA